MTEAKAKSNVTLRMTIVTPTFNEIGNIEILLNKIADVSATHKDVEMRVLVVDDSSPDGTAEEAERLSQALKTSSLTIEVLIRKKKDGLGKAYIFGFNHILNNYPDTDYLVQMDADLSHDPVYLSGFIHQAKEHIDFVSASRYMAGGGTPDWTLDRKFLSQGGNLYTRLLLGSRITDYTGGYNMYSSKLLKAINLATIEATGYGFQIEMKSRALQLTKKVAEIPIIFLDRKNGTSKIPKSTLVKNFILVAKIRYKR